MTMTKNAKEVAKNGNTQSVRFVRDCHQHVNAPTGQHNHQLDTIINSTHSTINTTHQHNRHQRINTSTHQHGHQKHQHNVINLHSHQHINLHTTAAH
jgi:hypothetical protein